MKNNLISLIGGTPTVRLSAIEKCFGIKSRLFAKLEGYNRSGSAKDRAALWIIADGMARGLVDKGSRVIEVTSGNMGISLSMISAIFGYRAVIFMPENSTEQRISLIKKYGGEVVLTAGDEGMMGASRRAEEMAEMTKNSYTPCQFSNKMGVLAHFKGTGAELFSDLAGNIDMLVCGVGTGATLMGAGGFLKSKNQSVITVAVEPSESALLSGGTAASHGITGIGAGFIPPLVDMNLIDRVVSLPTAMAEEMTELIYRKEGLSVGISSGAALYGAVSLALEDNSEKNIAVIFSDDGRR